MQAMQDWQRLAEALIARRVELGFRSRTGFVRGSGEDNDRLIGDLERGARDNYSPSTLALVERMYQWAPGSIRRVLAGGAPQVAGTEIPATDTIETTELRRTLDSILDILDSRFSNDTKLAMIRDVIQEDYLK